jgi:hypothetical protein
MDLPIFIIDEEQAIPPNRILTATVFVYASANISPDRTGLPDQFESPT